MRSHPMAPRRPRILVAFGTRPEVIKLAPVVSALRALPHPPEVGILVTAQHREMLDQMMAHFGLEADRDLDLMREAQTLPDLTARILGAVTPVLEAEQPDLLVVQGDTTTTFTCALAAFYQRVAIAHVEAGLRSGDRASPFPEEANRLLTSRLASLHFAPTERARQALLGEGVDADAVHLVGNTVVDALLAEVGSNRPSPACLEGPPGAGPLILVTLHRRENFGAPHRRVAQAIERILADRPEAWVLLPLHPNPEVARNLSSLLEHPRVRVTAPLPYPDFCQVLAAADLAISDSGGVQEEAPSVGTPVLVARDNTERPEAVAAGTADLVGSDPEVIVARADARLARASTGALPANPFGDGRSAARIADIVARFLEAREGA